MEKRPSSEPDDTRKQTLAKEMGEILTDAGIGDYTDNAPRRRGSLNRRIKMSSQQMLSASSRADFTKPSRTKR